ncbi:hypothetical protein DFH08DRAFT_1071681 [Mycena albidolilacea]|uniref:Uncharacterized protein n=1 Tax=Mycena albidolilacea TaxID=1033008 RepID=A0AAD7F539_9AGAR|nr:hypothetical protein DFH08DRAFT_1071681 [Mycena albidolilacea]
MGRVYTGIAHNWLASYGYHSHAPSASSYISPLPSSSSTAPHSSFTNSNLATPNSGSNTSTSNPIAPPTALLWTDLKPWMDADYARQVCALMRWEAGILVPSPHPPSSSSTCGGVNNAGYELLSFASAEVAAGALAQSVVTEREREVVAEIGGDRGSLAARYNRRGQIIAARSEVDSARLMRRRCGDGGCSASDDPVGQQQRHLSAGAAAWQLTAGSGSGSGGGSNSNYRRIVQHRQSDGREGSMTRAGEAPE